MILGITPVRGGSKGLPGKNIRSMAGKPLLAWTIEAAQKSNLLHKYVVCTEDDAIREVALSHNAEVVVRPKELAEDHVNRWDVLKYVIAQIPCRIVVLLQATSPARPEGFIDSCLSEFIQGQYDSLATGFWHHDEPYPRNRGKNRQEMTPRFFDDGNIYIWKSELVRNCPLQESGLKPCLRVNESPFRIDINDKYEFWLAERVLIENPFNCLR